MSKLVLLFVFVVALQLASSLQCYDCYRQFCETGLVTCQKIECGKSAKANEVPVCLKHVYKDDCHRHMVSRKCVFIVKDKPYKCNATAEEKFCGTCNTDLCNTASCINTTFGILFSLVLHKFTS